MKKLVVRSSWIDVLRARPRPETSRSGSAQCHRWLGSDGRTVRHRRRALLYSNSATRDTGKSQHTGAHPTEQNKLRLHQSNSPGCQREGTLALRMNQSQISKRYAPKFTKNFRLPNDRNPIPNFFVPDLSWSLIICRHRRWRRFFDTGRRGSSVAPWCRERRDDAGWGQGSCTPCTPRSPNWISFSAC
jgi:hypothetical protein